MKIALLFGFGTLGAIRHTVECLRRAAPTISPLVILNSIGAPYEDILPPRHILRTKHTNGHHQRIEQEINDRLLVYFGCDVRSVVAIINVQDFMWPCFLHLCSAFPWAKAFPEKEVVEATAIKSKLRELLSKTELAVGYSVVTLESAHFDQLEHLSASPHLIVKPLMGSASSAVSKIPFGDQSALSRAVNRAIRFAKRTYGTKFSCFTGADGARLGPHEAVLIEEYIDGVEFSIEGIASLDGKPEYVIQQQKTLVVEQPVFRDLEYQVSLPLRTDSDVMAAVQTLLNVVSYRGRAFHIELKRDRKGQIKLIEFNPRPGGGTVLELVRSIHGVDLIALPLCAFLNALEIGPVHTITRVIQPQERGTLTGFRGLRKLRAEPDCVFAEDLVHRGTIIKALTAEMYLIEFCVFGVDLANLRVRVKQLAETVRPVIVSTKPRGARSRNER